MVCKHCGAEVKSNQTLCKFCGCEIERIQQQAPQNVVINNYNYSSSGPSVPQKTSAQQNEVATQPVNINLVSSKNKFVALILCIFFGYFGLHKFYVGKKSIGLLYLFTMGIFGFCWLIDIALIATGNFKDKYGLKLK